MTVATSPLMTVEEFLALPDDGIERDLINGRVREYGKSTTRRNFRHTWTEANIAGILRNWLMKQPKPRGRIVSGEAGVRLRQDPPTTVGIDVAYLPAEMIAANSADAAIMVGTPVLVVEILSPSDKQEEILDKVRLYLDAGVALIWVIEPVFQTVLVYRPDARPKLFNASEELDANPHMPGLQIAVASIFDD